MSGILCSCRVPWRIAVLDGKSIELCPCCGSWRPSDVQVQPGLWQGEPDGRSTLPKRGCAAGPPDAVFLFGAIAFVSSLILLTGWLGWLMLG